MTYHYRTPVAIYKTKLAKDAYGQRRETDYQSPVWSGMASMQPWKTKEAKTESDASQEWFNVYIPKALPLNSTMRLVAKKVEYEIDGDPEQWPFGYLHYTRINIWRVGP